MKAQGHNDLSRKELMIAADKALATMGSRAKVHFKYTCQKCGERVMLQEPNTLYENGECYKCGHVQPITQGGFALVMDLQ
jgi:predicted SprT family Zn-dependent metalloprotease